MGPACILPPEVQRFCLTSKISTVLTFEKQAPRPPKTYIFEFKTALPNHAHAVIIYALVFFHLLFDGRKILVQLQASFPPFSCR